VQFLRETEAIARRKTASWPWTARTFRAKASGMRVTYLSLLFASSILMAACGGSTPQANDPSGTAEALHADGRESHGAPAAGEATGPLKAPGEAQIGDRSTCPVSGEEFVVTAESP